MRTALLILVFLSLIAPAQAQTVPANKSSVLYDLAIWMPDTCATFGKIKHTVRTPPKHGKLTFVPAISRAENLPARCKGKVKGLLVVYTPNRGYRGPDTFVVTVQTPRFLNDVAPVGRTLKPSFTVK